MYIIVNLNINVLVDFDQIYSRKFFDIHHPGVCVLNEEPLIYYLPCTNYGKVVNISAQFLSVITDDGTYGAFPRRRRV